MSNDDLILKKRLTELAEKAYGQGTYTFSAFLGLAEQDVLMGLERDIRHVPKTLWGGAEGCQRVMVRFGDEELCGYDLPFPIVCLRAAPTAPKYADKLTHRYSDDLVADRQYSAALAVNIPVVKLLA